MDIKEIIENIVEEIKSNKNLKEEFEKEPVKVIERVVGMDLPDALVEKAVEGVKVKLAAEMAVDKVSDVADALKKLF